MGKETLKSLGEKTGYKDQYDPSQLEPINRLVRREGFKHKMFGTDIWTAFEVSFLLPNGLPTSMVLRINNPASSLNIFESKSLKLYLNSFNNTTFKSKLHGINTISGDLTKLAGTDVLVREVDTFYSEDLIYRTATNLEDEVGDKVNIEKYDQDPELLEVIESGDILDVYSNLLRSNCEITNQPDWARIHIVLKGNKSVSKESLLKYIVSFRNHQEFHEPTCERIYQTLMEKTDPEMLYVACQYTRRGGIDINPVRTNWEIRNYWELPKLKQQ